MNKNFQLDTPINSKIDTFLRNNRNSIFTDLNFRITETEIKQAAQKLSPGKASGLDGILNEMLKSGIDILIPSLHKLFNLFLTSGSFPTSWGSNLLSPLHKKGDKLSCENYRGIAVGSNLSKLFCSVLHNRLSNFCDKNNVIPLNQIGYRKKTRTSDHILTLKNLIDKYITKAKRSYLYVCFVDFKSAFDTVWRKALIYKLLINGIGGNMLSVLENMYNNVSYTIKLAEGITTPITSNVGVKQGCVLSPLLFNIFLSDLPCIFDHSCSPVTLLDSKLSCLMFADDIVIFSESVNRLQNSLNKLQSYCSSWQLNINVKKTKIIIFNKGGHRISKNKFYYGHDEVEMVQSYCYLGIIFSASGNFNLALQNLRDKALKAFHHFRQFDFRNNILLALKLFDILNYGCEAWAPFAFKNLKDSNFLHLCNTSPIESINIKILQVSSGCTP